jgi:hypothetical protein
MIDGNSDLDLMKSNLNTPVIERLGPSVLTPGDVLYSDLTLQNNIL